MTNKLFLLSEEFEYFLLKSIVELKFLLKIKIIIWIKLSLKVNFI